MKLKELTEKQAFSIVEKIVKDNGLNLDVSLEGSNLKVLYKLEYQGQAKSLAKLFSGKNPKNTQDILSDDLGIFYLVNKDTLFTAYVYFRLEEDLAYEDSLDSILSDVLGEETDVKTNTAKKGYSADDIDSWITLLTELKVAGQKHLHFIEGEQLKQVAESLQALYNTPKAPLNRVLVTKFLEQWVSKNVSEDYFLDNFVEAAYKKLYKEKGKLKEGFATVYDTFLKYEHYHSLLLLSVIDSFETQNKVVTMVESIVRLDVDETAKWKEYVAKLDLEPDSIQDVLEYVSENGLEASDPARVLNNLYEETQNNIKEVQEISFKRSGVKGRTVEKQIINYMNKTYFGKQTPKKLRMVLDAYSLVQSIGSYIDWYMMLCERFIVGYAEVGVENEQGSYQEETQSEQNVEDIEVEADYEDFSSVKNVSELLKTFYKLNESETKSVVEDLDGVNSDNYEAVISGIIEGMVESIKDYKKRVVDSLALQPSASVKGRKITTKMNKYLKDSYLDTTDTAKGNCLRLYTKIKAENSTIEKELISLYKREILEYDLANQNEIRSIITADGVDFVSERVSMTKVLRKAETEETQTPEDILKFEEQILKGYNDELKEKVYAKSKDIITEYKKLFRQA